MTILLFMFKFDNSSEYLKIILDGVLQNGPSAYLDEFVSVYGRDIIGYFCEEYGTTLREEIRR